MILAWLITLPAAAVVGALMWGIGHLIGGLAGAITIVALLVAASAAMWWRSRQIPVDHHNVNDDWSATAPPADTPDERVPAAAAS
jgi:PiT family inorganic phosphate transporter